ncbi:MAG: hypothetical protein L3V56_03695 [Candidatus Magnetoovum sp. WYHC-5]|nr:hypothetical protein [Candidatus Magnetoovum sp. WYHC-5]
MRKQFLDINDLLAYYRYVKLQTESSRCILPSKERIDFERFNSVSAQSSMEEKLIFICDVENAFVRSYYNFVRNENFVEENRNCKFVPAPYFAYQVIFNKRVVEQKSYRQIARYFKYSNPVPKRFEHFQNIQVIYTAMIRNFQRCHTGMTFYFSFENNNLSLAIDNSCVAV